MTYITGTHAITEMLKKGVPSGSMLYVSRLGGKVHELELFGRSIHGLIVKKVNSSALDSMSAEHKGAVLAISGKARAMERDEKQSLSEYLKENEQKEKLFALILDGITDTHNLGAIIRSADCFAVDFILIPSAKSASLNETVRRVSSGALSYVKVFTCSNLVRDIKVLKDAGFWIYGADLDGENIESAKYSNRSAVILGSEGSGMRNSIKKECDFCLTIRNYGHIDSLNVSVAAAIFMYDFRLKNPIF